MKLTEMFLAEMEREAAATRQTLERFPEGKFDWKPHEKSMPMGYLAVLVATIYTWVEYIVKQDELDIAPKDGPKYKPQELRTGAELVKAFDASMATAREVLEGTNDAHLATTWKLLSGGKPMMEDTRQVMLRDTVFSHMAHHRGQLTVYLRLNEVPVPSIYGPSADTKPPA